MNKKIRVGIIGGGFGAKVHAPMMKSHHGFEVVSLASVGRGRINELKEETGIERVYSDWKEMLETEDLDLVSIASAPLLHHEMVLEAYEHGLDVLCEKPFAYHAKEAAEMIEARDRAKKLGLINFEFRFLPARQKIKEIVSSGQLGKLLHVNYTTSFPGYERAVTSRRGWLGQKDQAGGMLGAIGSHMFDSLLWWVDDEIKSISGQLSTHCPEYVDETGEKDIRTADDAFQTFGTFAGKTTFSLGLTSTTRHSQGWQFEIFGTEGSLIMTDDKKVFVGIGNHPLNEIDLLPDLVIPVGMSDVAARYYNAFYRSLDAVYHAVDEHEVSDYLPSFETGYKVQVILDAVRESSEKGRVIDL
ncbi:Gfo/Idh/MocA family protein [Anaerobacillus isosaccharinicus]|uniref:Gfo/Idh/MocA family oxidoreductase n=1 Tax=Anaerobacillus isosaccharinicus TaxID=1532552 RepID=A0A1S2KZL4_9BACI|nr:Gfo/Idh/MocA family oxidoreductase [Anaerobacillus isosaccharinicus]MBA5586857.1 Gfo/Idh/MocA family oxidoreductase [Anaerobacillus isosaccharinicus]QOY34931.1 Gfo/Idh/MocA family oxidoreductase [Anaerobacillus isosaccharinicus]